VGIIRIEQSGHALDVCVFQRLSSGTGIP